MDNLSAAKLMLSCLDLTSLNDGDTAESITDFCTKAEISVIKPAAICVFSKFVPIVKSQLENMKAATVINFPKGENDIGILEKEIPSAIALGADELDVVLPYRTLLNGEIDDVKAYLAQARKLCGRKILKIIIESGELKTVDKIRLATQLSIDAKADFVKTSTGKSNVSATPEAANAILEVIKASGKDVGFKASRGIKTFADAKNYLVLSQSIMGANWVNPEHFRIGASSLLKDLLKTIDLGY